jgi:hypothetical protein
MEFGSRVMGTLSSVELGVCGFWGPSIYIGVDLFPPRGVSALVGADVDVEGAVFDGAGEGYTEEVAVAIRLGFAVVEIEAAGAGAVFAGIAGVDAEFQRAGGDFVRALDKRLHGKDGSSADKDGEGS